MYLISYQADNNELLPKCICKSCELSLSLAYQFRVKVLQTHQIIEGYRKHEWSVNEIEEKANKSFEIVKVEFEDLVNESAAVEEFYLNEEILNNTRDMKVEIMETSFSDIDGINMENEEQEYLDLNEDECKPEYLEEFYNESNMVPITLGTEQVQLLKVSPDDNSTKELCVTEYISATTNNSDGECDNKVSSELCEKVVQDTMQFKRGPYKKRIKSNENKTYICDVCGNIFAKRGRMTEHRRRHDKELRYACE